MGKIEAPKRIRAEDYEKDERSMISKLSGTINYFNEQVYNVLNGNLDFFNLAQTTIDAQVSRDGGSVSSGTLTSPVQVKTNLTRKVIGISCISATNLGDITLYPESQPFIKFSINGVGNLTIERVTGLQANSSYSLKILLIT